MWIILVRYRKLIFYSEFPPFSIAPDTDWYIYIYICVCVCVCVCVCFISPDVYVHLQQCVRGVLESPKWLRFSLSVLSVFLVSVYVCFKRRFTFVCSCVLKALRFFEMELNWALSAVCSGCVCMCVCMYVRVYVGVCVFIEADFWLRLLQCVGGSSNLQNDNALSSVFCVYSVYVCVSVCVSVCVCLSVFI